MSAISIWAILSAAGAALWMGILRKSRGRAGRGVVVKFRFEDVTVAVGLALFFIWTIAAAPDEPPEFSASYFLGALVFYAGELFFIATFLLVREINPIAAFGLASARPVRVAAFGALCLVATYPAVEFLAQAASLVTRARPGQNALIDFLLAPNPEGVKLLAVVMVVVAAPVVEEVIFRGYLHGVMRQYCGRMASGVTTSLLFAAMHRDLTAFPAYFVLGLGFVAACELSGSLLASITMHVIFNSATVVAVFYFPELAK